MSTPSSSRLVLEQLLESDPVKQVAVGLGYGTCVVLPKLLLREKPVLVRVFMEETHQVNSFEQGLLLAEEPISKVP